MPAAPSLGKWPIKMPKLKPLRLLCPLHVSAKQDCCQNEQYWKWELLQGRRCYRAVIVIGPSNIQFAGVYVCTFQPRNFTGCNSDGVNLVSINLGSKLRWAGPWFFGNLMLINKSVVLASDAFLFVAYWYKHSGTFLAWVWQHFIFTLLAY